MPGAKDPAGWGSVVLVLIPPASVITLRPPALGPPLGLEPKDTDISACSSLICSTSVVSISVYLYLINYLYRQVLIKIGTHTHSTCQEREEHTWCGAGWVYSMEV